MVTTALHIDTVDEKRLQYRLSERNLTGLDTSTIKTAVQTLLPLINAKGIYDELPYDLCTDSFGGKAPVAVEGDQIIPFLQQAETIIAMSVTLGKDIDAYIDKFFTSGDFATGMLADCTAAAALDTLLNRLTEIIDITYSRDELKTAWRICPGEGDFPLSQQIEILASLQSEEIGVTVSPGRMISPRKTLTALAGLRSLQGGCSSCSGSCNGCSACGEE